MPTGYNNNGYRFSPSTFDLSDFATATSTEVADDSFTTVERLDVSQGEAYVVGRGASTNLLQAEGSISGDIQDGGGSDIDGRYRVVIENPQNNLVAVVAEGTINEIEKTRANNIDGDVTAFTGDEVYEPFQLALQLKTQSGTQTYDSGNTSLSIDGYRGEVLG